MKFIIIDDSKYKIENIKDCLLKLYPENTYFHVFNYRNAGIRYIVDNKVDIDENTYLILDMNFPIMSDTCIKNNAGLLILHNLDIRKINLKTIICSSETVEVEDKNVIGIVKYDASIDMSSLFFKILH